MEAIQGLETKISMSLLSKGIRITALQGQIHLQDLRLLRVALLHRVKLLAGLTHLLIRTVTTGAILLQGQIAHLQGLQARAEAVALLQVEVQVQVVHLQEVVHLVVQAVEDKTVKR